jgi:DNA-binding winged helix-turn-helix (wHTH) protein
LRRRGGKAVRLSGQPLWLLVLLLDQPGRVVTGEEIRTLLWPDTTVNFDHSLDVALNRLRAALGDNGKKPRFARRFHGYRSLAEVQTAIDRPRAIRGRSTAARVGLYALTAIIAALIALAIVHQHYDKFVDRPRACRVPDSRANHRNPTSQQCRWSSKAPVGPWRSELATLASPHQ